MTEKTYRLPFDTGSGRYEKTTIVADVVPRGQDVPCPLDRAEFRFPEEFFELTADFEPGREEVRAEVALREEVYEAGDFIDIVAEEYEFFLEVVPREGTPDGGFKPGPVLRKACIVQCEPVRPAMVLKEPAEEELPLPAVGDEPTRLVLQVTMGAGGRPWKGLELRWERVEGGCSVHGALEGEDIVTDEAGEIQLTYTAPRLCYTPGEKYFEEYRFLGAGKQEQELFRLRIPLAPQIVYRMKAEKTLELDGERYGIDGPLSDVVEIDPHDRVKALEGTLLLKTTIRGREQQDPVADMECSILLGDENGVPEDQEGIKLTTDAKGKIRWEAPELAAAFGDRGTTRQLSTERGELPSLEPTEATEKVLEFHESRFEQPSFPRGVFQGGLEEELRSYRLVHNRQLASREIASYQKIRDTLEILSIGTRYVAPFRRCHTEMFSPLLGVLGDTFWDYFNYLWNLHDMAEKIIGALAGGASAIAQAIASRCKGSVSFLRTLLARIRPLRWAIDKAAGFFEWLVTKVEGLAAFAGEYVGKLRQVARDLAKQATELVSLMGQVESKGMKALAGLVAGIKGLVANVTRGISFLLQGAVGVLERFAFWLMTHAAAGLRVFERSFFEHLEGYTGMEAIHRGIRFFMDALGARWHGKLAEEGVMVQAGNFLQSVVEAVFGKGGWVTGGASRSVSNFASLNLFDPAATVAVRSLHRACSDLRAADDPKQKGATTREMAASVAQTQLTYEKSFIMGEAIKMFVDSMKIPVQVAVAAAVTLTTLGGGTFAVAGFCTKMELTISTLAICLLDVPHAVTIFLGGYLIQQGYLTAVANLEV